MDFFIPVSSSEPSTDRISSELSSTFWTAETSIANDWGKTAFGVVQVRGSLPLGKVSDQQGQGNVMIMPFSSVDITKAI